MEQKVKDLYKRFYEDLSDEELTDYLDIAEEGLKDMSSFPSAVKILTIIAQYLYGRQKNKEIINRNIELLQVALKSTKGQENLSNIYIGLVFIYDKLGDNYRVLEYSLLFENMNAEEKNPLIQAQLTSIYTHISCVLEEYGFYEESLKYNNKSFAIQCKNENLQSDYYYLTYYVNQTYLLIQTGNMFDAIKMCDKMLSILSKAESTPALEQIRPACEVAKLTLDIFLDPKKYANDYITFMASVELHPEMIESSAQTLEQHVAIVKKIKPFVTTKALYAVCKFLINNQNFTGERITISEIMLDLIRIDPTLSTKEGKENLKKLYVASLKRKVEEQKQEERALTDTIFRINDIKRELDRTQNLYETDYLTKANTRIYLEYNYNSYFEKFPDGSVSFIDINFFKEINDTYGHVIGDEVLKLFVKRINSCTNVNVKLCRYGGDEFIMISPYNVEKTTLLIQKLQKEFDEPLVIGEQKFIINFSYGVIKYLNQPLNEIIQASDDLMYANKRTFKVSLQ